MKKRIVISVISACLVLAGLLAVAGKGQWKQGPVNDNAASPDAREEFRRLFIRYSRQDSSFGIGGTVKLYDAEVDFALKESTQFSFINNETGSCTIFGPITTILFDGLLIECDSLSKTVSVYKAPDNQTNNTGHSFLPSVDKSLDDTSAAGMKLAVTESNGLRILHISNGINPDIRTARIIYNPKTYQLVRTETEWWKSSINRSDDDKRYWLTEMKYQENRNASSFSTSEKVARMIKLDGKRSTLTKEYSGYELKWLAE